MAGRVERLGMAALFIGVFAAAVWMAQGFDRDARVAPTLVGVLSLLAAAGVVVHELLRPGRRPPGAGAGTTPGRRADTGAPETSGTPPARLAAMAGWLAGFVLLVWLVGLLYSVPLFVLGFLAPREPYRRTLLITAGTWAGFYLLFAVALHIHLYPGVLFEPRR